LAMALSGEEIQADALLDQLFQLSWRYILHDSTDTGSSLVNPARPLFAAAALAAAQLVQGLVDQQSHT